MGQITEFIQEHGSSRLAQIVQFAAKVDHHPVHATGSDGETRLIIF